MSEEEKNKEAELLVDKLIAGYDKLHEYGMETAKNNAKRLNDIFENSSEFNMSLSEYSSERLNELKDFKKKQDEVLSDFKNH